MLRPLALTIALALGLSVQSAAADVILINVFEVPQSQREEAITAWELARDFLAQQPGYISTALHASVSPDARFELINIAQWQSPEAFMAATQAMQAAEIFPAIDGMRINPALYTVIRSD